MTTPFERRIRKLEARAPASSRSVIVFGLPGRPEPDPACIGPGDLVVRVSFVGSRDGRQIEEGDHARH